MQKNSLLDKTVCDYNQKFKIIQDNYSITSLKEDSLKNYNEFGKNSSIADNLMLSGNSGQSQNIYEKNNSGLFEKKNRSIK